MYINHNQKDILKQNKLFILQQSFYVGAADLAATASNK